MENKLFWWWNENGAIDRIDPQLWRCILQLFNATFDVRIMESLNARFSMHETRIFRTIHVNVRRKLSLENVQLKNTTSDIYHHIRRLIFRKSIILYENVYLCTNLLWCKDKILSYVRYLKFLRKQKLFNSENICIILYIPSTIFLKTFIEMEKVIQKKNHYIIFISTCICIISYYIIKLTKTKLV